jgi:hypothetical protein
MIAVIAGIAVIAVIGVFSFCIAPMGLAPLFNLTQPYGFASARLRLG